MASKNIDKAAKALGEQLKNAREKAKLTQADVAAAIGAHVNYYARMERGEQTPSLELLQKVMKALKIKSLNIKTEE